VFCVFIDCLVTASYAVAPSASVFNGSGPRWLEPISPGRSDKLLRCFASVDILGFSLFEIYEQDLCSLLVMYVF
jgi:hypothetical protein